MIANSRHSIQGRILRALLVLLTAVFCLSGLSLYTIYDAQRAFREAHDEIEKSREHLFDLRLSAERAAIAIENLGLVKTEDARHLEALRQAKSAFDARLVDLQKTDPELKDDLASLSQKFSALEKTTREAGTLNQMAAELRRQIFDLAGKSTLNHENSLNEGMKTLIFLIVAMAIGVLVIPTGVFWIITQRINHDLNSFVRSLDAFSGENDKTSEALRAASHDLSTSASQQSAAVQQTISSITEIRAMLGETENHIREVESLTATMNEKTQDGSQIMNRMDLSMHAIDQANSQLVSFEEIIRSIRGKTRVINDIVFKTQLLSFNASIEAARAGQYGRGFAVVAEEVGKLAQLSGDASKEIDHLLSTSQDRVVKIIESVRDRVSEGKDVSDEALTRFTEIARQISTISDKVNQVGVAAVEQAGGIEQTARAMDQMNETAHKNKLGSENILQISDRVRDMNAKVREVTEGVRRFARKEYSRESSSASPHKSPSPSLRHQNLKAVSTTNSSTFNEDEEILKIVSRLSSKQNIAPIRKPSPSLSPQDISADDPSFRKTSEK